MTKLYISLSLLFVAIFFIRDGFGQATIQVTVTSVQTSSSVDCDNLPFDITGASGSILLLTIHLATQITTRPYLVYLILTIPIQVEMGRLTLRQMPCFLIVNISAL
jgi:hypothetical protein